jgi:hypothetical protein
MIQSHALYEYFADNTRYRKRKSFPAKFETSLSTEATIFLAEATCCLAVLCITTTNKNDLCIRIETE